MAKTYTAEYIGEGNTYTVIFNNKPYSFKTGKAVAGIPEDVAIYVSGLKEDNSTRARLLFNVTEDSLEALMGDTNKPKVTLGVKKPIKTAEKSTTSDEMPV